MKAVRESRLGARSQSLLAKRIGVSQSELSRWENGRREPGILDFVKYARACGVGLDYLLHGGSSDVATQGSVILEPVTLDADASKLVQGLVRFLEGRSHSRKRGERLVRRMSR